MRNLFKFIVIFAAMLFTTATLMAQSETSPQLQKEKQKQEVQLINNAETPSAANIAQQPQMINGKPNEPLTIKIPLKPKSKDLESVYPQSVDYWTGTTDGSSYTQTSMVEGYGATSDGYMMFDLAAIPAGSVIVNVTFNGYVTTTNYPYWSLTPCYLDPLTATAADLRAHIETFSTPETGYYYGNEPSTYGPGWKIHDLENTGIADMQAALANGWFAIGILERDGTDTYYLVFDGWNETNVPYLEVDYFVPEFGALNGTVTELSSGNPMENVSVTAVGPYDTYSMLTLSDGTYEFDPAQAGDYDITVEMMGYNVIMEMDVACTAGNTTTTDFALTSPTMDIDPLSIDVTLDPGATATEVITITNNGNGDLGWSASVINNTGKFDPTSTAYAYMAYDGTGGIPEGPVSFTLNDPAVLTPFGVAASNFVATAEWVDDVWYGVVYGGTFITIDMVTGLNTVIGPCPDLTGMAYDWTQDVMYGVDFAGTLYTIDLTTGAGTPVATTIPNLITMVCDNDGILYGFDLNLDGFGTIDKVDGTWTLISTVGFDFIYAQDASVDHETNTIYWAAYGAAGELYTIDQVDGTTTLIGGFANGAEVAGFAIPGAPATWIGITPSSGTIEPGGSGTLDVFLDATEILPGTVLEADVHFMSDPNVGEQDVHVTLTVGILDFGHIVGNVFLDGAAPYNIGDVTEVLVEAGSYFAYPNSDGDYDILTYPGTYDVTATLYGYETQTTTGVTIVEGGTETIDYTMPCILGILEGTVTDAESGDPIEMATVSIIDQEMEFVTGADGTYSFHIEAGTYDVQATHSTYATSIVTDLVIDVETTVVQDFELTFQCEFCAAEGGCDEFIDGIEFGMISNLNTGCSNYANYTDMSTILIPGLAETLTLYTGNMYTSDDYAIWIDWNIDCEFTADELVVCEFDSGQDIWTWDISAPLDATPGFTTMRVRLKWSGSDCGEPCGTTSYGEVEDYGIIVIAPEYGDLSGYVTELGTGTAIEDATVTIDGTSFMQMTDGTGYYEFLDLPAFTWDVTAAKEGYNSLTQEIEIVMDIMNELDFELSFPIFEVDPLAVNVTLEPNATTDETVVLSNTGNGPVDWGASVVIITDETKDVWDLQFSLDLDVASGAPGNAGAECDGMYYYTTRWASNLIHKYDLDGTLVEEFSIPGVTGLRDLAYDGTYFYGGAAANTIYQMDFDSQTLVSSISSSQPVRNIAYDDGENACWVANWDTDIALVDMGGSTINTLPASTHGLGGMYGSAYDMYSAGGPYLWIFDQGAGAGAPQIVYSADLNSMTMTGDFHDVTADLPPNASAIAGGLFIAPDIYPGTVSMGGLIQGVPDMLFVYEFGESGPVWLTIDSNSGMLEGGETHDMNLHFDATGLIPGVYEAEIQFNTDPNVGSPIVAVTLTVEGLCPPINLAATPNCLDLDITWEMPNGCDAPDSWKVYKDGVEVADVTDMMYTDPLLDPGVTYSYAATAVYDGDESMMSVPDEGSVEIPGDLEPSDFYVDVVNYTVTSYWSLPVGCAVPDGYNVYRDGVKVNTSLITDLFFVEPVVPQGFFEYKAKAVYYFGDSGFSNVDWADVPSTGIGENPMNVLSVYPNPAHDVVNISASYTVKSIEVLNNIGQVVISSEINDKVYQFNVSTFEKGIYFIKIETGEGDIKIKKITVN